MKKIYIVGAGLSGLLAANILRKYNPIIFESQKELPNNHTALLRFRELKVSESTSIPFEKVKVKKAIYYDNSFVDPSLYYSNMYSFKVTGEYSSRSINNIDDCYRYIAPENFIEQLALGCEIKFGESVDLSKDFSNEDIVISTLPMPVSMKQFNYHSDIKFEKKNITIINAYIDEPKTELYQTIYYPNIDIPTYRASITKNKLIIELLNSNIILNNNIVRNSIHEILKYNFGIDQFSISHFSVSSNSFGKISPIDDGKRKKFISWLTKEHNIYSLGRYAIWKNILLDDVHDDIYIIKKLIESKGYIK